MELYQSDISDTINVLNGVERIDQPAMECDLFLCTLGFEDRTHKLVTEFSESGALEGALVLLVQYPTNVDDNLANLPAFEAAASTSFGLKTIDYSRNEYSGILAESLNQLIGHRANARVVFDISTCSSYVLYPTLKQLIDLDVELTIVYTEAEEYFPTFDEWTRVASQADSEEMLFTRAFEEAEFQSIGVDDVYSSPIFSEMNPGNRPTVLVAVPNFSASRMQTVITRDQEINKTPSSRVHWLIGEPPGTENKWRAEAVQKTNGLVSVQEANVHYVSTLDYKETITSLENIWLATRHEHHMAIGSLGSKMQHLGTFFFVYLHKDVGLWLAEPKRFQAGKFSSGRGPSWRVPLGRSDALRKKLDEYMNFKWRL